MRQRLCGCSSRTLDIQQASYALHGIPFCTMDCLDKYEARYRAKQQARREQVTRDVPLASQEEQNVAAG